MIFSKINYKMIILSIFGCLLTTILTIAIMYSMVERYAFSMEKQDMEDTYTLLQFILNHEEENLKRTNLDWAHWDDTYHYMQGQYPDYEDVNLKVDTLKQLHLNVMFFLDKQGNLVYSLSQNVDGAIEKELIETIQSQINQSFRLEHSYDIYSGIAPAGGKVFILSLTPITTTDEKADSCGVLVVGSIMDPGLFYYINSVSKAKIDLSEDEQDAETLPLSDATQIIRDEQNMTQKFALTDIFGRSSVVATITMPRSDYAAGKKYINLFSVISFVVVGLIFALLLRMIYIYFLRRLNQIHYFVEEVRRNKIYTACLYVTGRDEISKIAQSINQMLEEIMSAKRINQIVNERLEAIFLTTEDGYFEYNFMTKEYYISSKWSQLIAVEPDNPEFNPWTEYMKRIYPEFTPLVESVVQELFEGKHNYQEIEYKIRGEAGKAIWVQQKARIIERSSTGQAVRIVSILLDVTARKLYEEKILRLSYYDKLTSLRNRAYVEELFQTALVSSGEIYHIIMGDVNGLKLVNDTFGHQEGDRLIQAVGDTLQKIAYQEMAVARWGGDEFVIICAGRSDHYVDALLMGLQKSCTEIDRFSFRISIALGAASSGECDSIETVMNLAEERMYRSKLLAVKSARHATVTSLERTLYEKSAETEAHTQRIKALAIKLGKKLGLTQDQLHQLELLSLLHDIGKIGIPEQVLLKPGPLSETEWKIMKQHTDIGYRIAMATPELSHVADEILCHHERFDGTGYPQGLRGEQIPILSRIINVIDSFDVITHKRDYKEAASIEFAVAELDRCSGTQFDPQLVKVFKELLIQEGIYSVTTS